VLNGFTLVVPLRQVFELWDAKCLYRLLTRERPDVLHVNNGGFPGAGSCNAAAIAGGLARVPVVYVVNNAAAPYRSPTRWPDFLVDRLVARSVSQFVTGSTAAATRLRETLRLRPEHVRVLHNGIAVRSPDESVDATRRRLAIASNAILVVSIARLEKRKGHKHLLDAVALIKQSGAFDHALFMIEGVGPEQHSLRAQSAALGIDDRVRFIGEERNIANLYQAADVVALPSIAFEDFPNTVLEAMAFSKPVVASDIAGVPEQIVDGITGILVPPGRPQELAAAISQLSNNSMRETMGMAGRLRFEELFTAERAFAGYRTLYDQLLGSVAPSRAGEVNRPDQSPE
jgi:glycosyltransferase involved in cell wall biosynthesis